MKLGDEILTNNNIVYIGRYVSQMYRKGNAYIGKQLSDIGVGSGQFMFLLELYRKDGRSQEELSEILSIDKGTTARAIKKLEDDGFLYRERDENDKRAYKIYLTDKGNDAKQPILDALKSWEDIITSRLSSEERIILDLLLNKISRCK